MIVGDPPGSVSPVPRMFYKGVSDGLNDIALAKCRRNLYAQFTEKDKV